MQFRSHAASRLAIALVAGALLAKQAAAAPGDPDTSFSGDGLTSTAVGGGSIGRAVVQQSDGKLVVAGTGLASTDFALVRYLPDGSLDTSFGSGGTVTTSFSAAADLALAAALQPDGKIVAAGLKASGLTGDVALARYNSDGSLDASFGSGGLVATAVSPQGDGANALALQPDGKIVVAGY